MRKRQVFFTIVLALAALVGLGVGVVLAQEQPPQLLLEQDMVNDQIRIHACGVDESQLPTTFNFIQFGSSQESSFEWNPDGSGCYTQYSVGGTGSLGISKIIIPSGSWELGFYDQLSGNLWQTEGTTIWSQAEIDVTLSDALCQWVDDPSTDLQVGNCREVTLVVSTTVPYQYRGQFTVGGSPVSVTSVTTVTLSLNGAISLGMTEGQFLSPVTWSCSLQHCPADVVEDGLRMKSIPFNYGLGLVDSGQGGFVYELGVVPNVEWIRRSVELIATLSWGNSSWTMCPAINFPGLGKVTYSPTYWEGSVEQSATLVVQPGDWTTPFAKLLGPEDCVKERIFLPFALM